MELNLEEIVAGFLYRLQTGQLTELPSQIYVLIAGLTLIEGPLTTLVAATVASAGLLNPALVFLSASAGNLTGDIFWHSLGRAGKLHWLLRGNRRVGLEPERLEWFDRKIKEHAAKIIFLTKVSSSFIIPSLISTGLARLPWRRWFPALLTAEILWTGSLIAIGYFAARFVPEITNGLRFLPVLGVLILACYITISMTRRAISHFLDNPI